MLRAVALGAGFGLGQLHYILGRDTQEAVQDRTPALSAGQRAVKRLLDVLGSLLGLFALAPLTPIIAVLIKMESRGPVLYAQDRVGEGGKVFRMYKFRSMVANAEAMQQGPPEPGGKLPEDPRVTRVGRILRRTSLDEAPQFWNVLMGDMSLVGPRPEEAGIVRRQYDDWHRQRLAVKPGMTGPMQTNGRAELPLDERVKLELAYVKEYSLRKDIEILLKTLPALLGGRGAY
jgi:lipopolysaccharide/colanic/teichoic acid biosynthesis glycosyltransferase